MSVRRDGIFNRSAEGTLPRFDMLFDRVFGENGGLEAVATSWANAPMAIWEDEDHVYVEVDAPGVSETDIDLTLHQGLLTIQGERKPVQDRKYLYNSRNFGQFERTVRLPETITGEGVEARMRDGVLSLTLKKTLEAKPKKIVVQRAE